MSLRLLEFHLKYARLQFVGLAMLALVSRSPLMRLLPAIESVVKAPLARALQFAATAIGFAGANHALTGATTFSTNPATPVTTPEGEDFSLVFTLTGTPAPVSSWRVTGSLPPGLNMPGRNGNILNENIGTITGVPTTPGDFEFTVQAFKGLNNTDITNDVAYPIRIIVEATQLPPLETIFNADPSQELVGTTGEAFSMTFSISGMDAQSWRLSGDLPPGLALTGPSGQTLSNDVLNAPSGVISGTPSLQGDYSITLQAYEGLDLAGRSDDQQHALSFAIASGPSPYEIWKAEHFEEGDAPDDGDPDLDGLPNLIEYALQTDPNHPDNRKTLEAALVELGGATRIQIMVQRDPTRNDISLRILGASSPLGPWAAIATSEAGAPFSGTAHIEGEDPQATEPIQVFIAAPETVEPEQARFLRLAVETVELE